MNIVYKNSKHFEERGSLYTVYDDRQMNDLSLNFVQDKISKSYQGVIRGFHGDDKTWKLISCLHGRVKLITYDVERDHKEVYELDAESEESTSILVPPKTLNAHQCLSSSCIFYYKWSEYYTMPSKQWSVKYNDPDISPCWEQGFHDIISNRDRESGSLADLKLKLKG